MNQLREDGQTIYEAQRFVNLIAALLFIPLFYFDIDLLSRKGERVHILTILIFYGYLMFTMVITRYFVWQQLQNLKSDYSCIEQEHWAFIVSLLPKGIEYLTNDLTVKTFYLIALHLLFMAFFMEKRVWD